MIQIKKFTFNPFQENTYVLYDETTECIVIDPGCFNQSEEQELASFIANNNLNVKMLINTHAHIDHVLGNHFVAKKYKVGLCLYQSEYPMLDLAKRSSEVYGIPYTPSPEAEHTIKEGDVVEFGNQRLQVLFVPGHSPDHIVLYDSENKILMGGDVLFQGSIGRTDLPGGNHDQLIQNIKDKIFTLNEDTVVYSGHGNETTIGVEKKTNPFF